MKRTVWTMALLAASLVMLVSCAGPYIQSRSDIFKGRQLLANEEYAEARQEFVKAAEAQPSTWAYAFIATASYKMNDLAQAQAAIDDALKMDGRSDAYMRVLAYKGLILLKEGRREEGIEALRYCLNAYRDYYPIPHRGEIERLLNAGASDLPRLERLLDQAIKSYESDIAEWLSTGTGYMAERYGKPLGREVPYP